MMIHDIITEKNFKPGDLVVSNKPMQLSGFIWSKETLLNKMLLRDCAISLSGSFTIEGTFYLSIYKKSSIYMCGSYTLISDDAISVFNLNEFTSFLSELIQNNDLVFVVPPDNYKFSKSEPFNLMYLIPSKLLSFYKKAEKHLLLDFSYA